MPCCGVVESPHADSRVHLGPAEVRAKAVVGVATRSPVDAVPAGTASPLRTVVSVMFALWVVDLGAAVRVGDASGIGPRTQVTVEGARHVARDGVGAAPASMPLPLRLRRTTAT